jgi:chemotaxis protein CheX
MPGHCEAEMQPYEADIQQSVESLWSSILGLGVVPGTGDSSAEELDRSLTSGVGIEGAWRGFVRIQCPDPLARLLTASMFGDSPDVAGPEQIQDALGELANITGGNFKSLLPEPCSLSLPKYGPAVLESIRSEGLDLLSQVGFLCDGYPFLVSVYVDPAPK